MFYLRAKSFTLLIYDQKYFKYKRHSINNSSMVSLTFLCYSDFSLNTSSPSSARSCVSAISQLLEPLTKQPNFSPSRPKNLYQLYNSSICPPIVESSSSHILAEPQMLLLSIDVRDMAFMSIYGISSKENPDDNNNKPFTVPPASLLTKIRS